MNTNTHARERPFGIFAGLLFAAALVLGMVTGPAVAAHADDPQLDYDLKQDGVRYSVVDGEAAVTGAVDAELLDPTVIPEEIVVNGSSYRVTAIGERAFFGKETLGTVTIPDSVTSIGASAFERSSVSEADLPQALTELGENAFYSSGITRAQIPPAITVVPQKAFGLASSLTDLRLHDGITDIADNAFQGIGITSVDLHEGLRTVGGSAFLNVKLTSLSIPSTLESIGWGAFSNSSITSIEIPATVKSLGDRAFALSPLEQAEFLVGPDGKPGVSEVPQGLFYGDSIGSITLPEGIKAVGTEAFYQNATLTDVTLPESLGTIGDNAFRGTNLSRVDIPANVTEIGRVAFEGNDNLKIVAMHQKVAPQVSPESSGLGSFPRGIEAVLFDCDATGFDAPEWNGFPSRSECGVAYALNGGQWVGDGPAAVTNYGFPLDKPANPQREGFEFAGWFIDDELTTEYDFNAKVRAPVTLLAKWREVVTHTVTFDSQQGSLVESVVVEDGSPVGEPAAPSRDGFVFTGWFTDASAESVYDFAAPVTGDLTLFAGWEVKSQPPVAPEPPVVTPDPPVKPGGGGPLAESGGAAPALLVSGGVAALLAGAGVLLRRRVR